MSNIKELRSKNPLYPRWSGQKHRCRNSKHHQYKNYGGRGITISDEFFDDFYTWYYYVMSLKNAHKEGYSIDRIDNDKGYQRGNLRWSTFTQQILNKRMQKNNKSGYVGVSSIPYSGKWHSGITVNKKTTSFGCFNNKIDAVKARNNYIIEHNLTEYKVQNIK